MGTNPAAPATRGMTRGGAIKGRLQALASREPRPTKAGLSTQPSSPFREGRRSKYSSTLGVTKDVEGVVIWTNQSIQSKHDATRFRLTHRVIDVTPEAKSFYLSVIVATAVHVSTIQCHPMAQRGPQVRPTPVRPDSSIRLAAARLRAD